MSEEPNRFTPPQNMDQVPKDRVFCTAVLYLTEDNRIAGGVDYKGNLLKQLGVSNKTAMECSSAEQHLERYVRKAIDHAKAETEILYQFMNMFGITEEDLEQDDNNSVEGSSTAESASA